MAKQIIVAKDPRTGAVFLAFQLPDSVEPDQDEASEQSEQSDR